MPNVSIETGVDLYYEEKGSGPAVVLVQGTGFALDVWSEHPVEELSANFRVITLDPRGVGRSKAQDEFITVEQMASDIASLLRYLEVDTAHLVGHSIGGRICLALALTYPKMVSSLTLAATGSGAAIRAGEDAYPMPQHRLLQRLIERGLEEHVRYEILETDGYFTESFRESSQDVVAAFYERAWRNHADLPWYLRQVMARHSFEATHRLPFLRVPSMVLVGGSDVAGGGPHVPASKALADRIKGCELQVLDGVSHGFFWQEPDMTASVLSDWFKRH